MDWIRTQDKKPQDHQRCLAVHPKRRDEYKITIARWYAEFGCFIEDMEDYGFFAEYWQPLELPSAGSTTLLQRVRNYIKSLVYGAGI